MRLSERLMWIFAALFVLCGAPLLFMEPPDGGTAAGRLAGTAAACLGAFALCLCWNGWETGRINVQHFHYTRAGQPRRFAATLVMILAAGLGTLATAVWFFFFK